MLQGGEEAKKKRKRKNKKKKRQDKRRRGDEGVERSGVRTSGKPTGDPEKRNPYKPITKGKGNRVKK